MFLVKVLGPVLVQSGVGIPLVLSLVLSWGGGVPLVLSRGYPPDRTGYIPRQDRGTPRQMEVISGHDSGVPPDRITPLGQVILQAVRLLQSRRRTFLFY